MFYEQPQKCHNILLSGAQSGWVRFYGCQFSKPFIASYKKSRLFIPVPIKILSFSICALKRKKSLKDKLFVSNRGGIFIFCVPDFCLNLFRPEQEGASLSRRLRASALVLLESSLLGFSSSLRLIMHFSPCQSNFITWVFLLGAFLVFSVFHLTFFPPFQQLAYSLYDYWLYHMPIILKVITIGIPQQKCTVKSMGCEVR